MNVKEFNNNYICPLLEKISQEKKKAILLGDFNMNLLNYDSNNDVRDFLDSMTSNFFLPFISQPSRVTSRSKTLIDNIYFNSIEHKTISSNITASISDHMPQFWIISNYANKTSHQAKYGRSFKNFDRENFLLDVLSINWNPTLELDKKDVNLSCQNFLSTVNSIVDKYAPIRKLSKKERKAQCKPWVY